MILMRKWHLETRNIEALQDHPKNARSLTKDQAKHLMQSMAKFGLIDKPIITPDGNVIGGHQRLKVLKQLGHEEVECWVCNEELSDSEIDELNIRLNKNTGEWDWDVLANEWDINLLCEWGFSVKEFHDEDKGKLEGKPKVTIEFKDSEALEDAMRLIEEIASSYDVKVKVKV
jgi:ParB-like chromosome segregation protein Spo0J